MATKLPQDLGRLRDECAARFADNPVARYVTRTIIKGIVVLWTDDQQGIPESEAIRIDVSLSPIFDALMGAPTMQEAYEHLAELVAAWEKIDPFAAGIGDWPTFEFN